MPPTLEELRAALADPRTDVRRRVALACADAPAEAAREPLLAALADPAWSVREAAATALGRFSDPDGSVHTVLVGLVLHDPAPLVRRAAALAAGPRIDPQQDFAAAIGHRFERQRARAAFALGFASVERAAGAVELLATAAADPHPKVRTAALRSLARFDPSATLRLLPLVARRCAEAEPDVATAARELWKHLVAHPAAEALRPLGAFAEAEPGATGAAVAELPADHPLRLAWGTPDEPRDPRRLAQHVARVCARLLAGAAT